MVKILPIFPDRVRRVPKQFSWLDHRLVRDHYIDRCAHGAAALYLFLVTVGDGKGMSYYMVGGELARTAGPMIILGVISWWGLEGTWRLIPSERCAEAMISGLMRPSSAGLW